MIPVWIDDIDYCPFCRADIAWRNHLKGTVCCGECRAEFSVSEHEDSKRPTEEELEADKEGNRKWN